MRNALSKKHFVAALVALGAISACSNTPPAAVSVAAPSSPTQTTVTAPAQSVVATANVGAKVFSQARARESTCSVSRSTIHAIRFESMRFLVRLNADDDCVKRVANGEAWLNASDVTIANSAYAPALARVEEQAGLRIAMAYVGNKIFCDDKMVCRINESLYANARCYAAPAVATALANAARALATRDSSLTLKVLDCYRPIYVQERMFSLVADPKWVAQPKPPRYGGHNRAVAIDVTIEKNGVEFDMGTPFDAFDEKSEWHDDGRGLSAAQQSNRRLLRSLMIEHGFRPYDGEWWHFSLPIDTPALNLPL
jgi:D-alanyl-D-alanine dipeptidase